MINQESNPPVKTKTPFFYGYVIVATIFIIQIIMVGSNTTSGVFFKPLINEFGWSRALISGAFSLSRIIMGLSSIAMGALNDRFGPRIVVTISGLLLGGGFLLMPLTTEVWQLYLFYVISIGAGMGSVFASQMSTVAKWFTQKRNLMTGIVFAGGSLGGLIMPPAVTWLIFTTGWQNSYLVLGAVAMVIIVLGAQFLKGNPYQIGQVPYGANNRAETRERQHNPINKAFSLKEAISTWQFWILLMVFFCNQFCLSTISVHIVPHATDLGISSATAANILAASSAGLMTGSLVIGITADKIGTRKAFVICFIPMLAVLLLLLPVTEAWMIGLFVFISACGNASSAMLVSTLCAELFGMKSHGLILGFSFLMGALGGALGPFAAGYLFDTYGNYQWAFFLCGVLVAAALVMAISLRPITKPVENSASML